MTSSVSAEGDLRAGPPDWFHEALGAPVEIGSVTVDGTVISYRAFGGPGGGGIVLVHGGAAHARWWDHIAPLLANADRVVALDLSGHGDSGRREVYTLDCWAREVLAVADAAGISDPPVVIGHSMGGFVALRVAGLYGSRLEGIVVIDSPVRDITPEEQAARDQRAFGPLRVYPTRAAAIARFHPIPDQPALPYVAAHVAATSIRAVSGGWTWKFDPARVGRKTPIRELLPQAPVRMAFVRCEQGLLTADRARQMAELADGGAPVIALPAAGHHPMFDQPLALVTALRAILAFWGGGRGA